MVGWHHQIYGHEFEQALGVGNGQGSLACCSPWGLKESDMTEQLNWLTEEGWWGSSRRHLLPTTDLPEWYEAIVWCVPLNSGPNVCVYPHDGRPSFCRFLSQGRDNKSGHIFQPSLPLVGSSLLLTVPARQPSRQPSLWTASSSISLEYNSHAETA